MLAGKKSVTPTSGIYEEDEVLRSYCLAVRPFLAYKITILLKIF